ncbi:MULTISPECIES: carbon-nitrogen hydrolase family protein [Oceanotoga]|uniref:carbon-nitrogen hydrolase family protein n=1 Tax=Oceanotoga TaxID=1255275 RepID=UPI00272E39E5|nr:MULTISPECIES: carbon-nitrogen hydrolase family protein [Oceanotoga]
MVQMYSKFNDINQNLEKHIQYIKKAHENNCDTILFPELSLIGYDLNQISNYKSTYEQEQILKEQALKYQMNILYGTIHETNDKKYITHKLINKDKEEKIYKKIHLGKNEKKYFNEGNEIPIFQIQSKKEKISIAFGICYDMHFPELSSIYAKNNVKIIFSPHASYINANMRLKIWNKYMMARAYDNQLYIIACNNIFYKDDQILGGGIAVWNKKGEIEIKEETNKEKMIIHKINPFQYEGKRSNYLKDKKYELYKKYI